MVTYLPKEPVVEALVAEWAALDDLLSSLDDPDWARPTACPGWDVSANVAHIIGTEAMLLGEPQPEVNVDVSALAHVRNDMAAFNEAWVVALAGEAPAALLERLRSTLGRRREALDAMDEAAWREETFTPAGPDSYGRFMRLRLFDTWMHEQDVREATDRPGHVSGSVVEVVLDEMASVLGYVVGKRAAAPTGASVTFDLTGPSGRQVHVQVGDRGEVVPALEGPASATLSMPVLTFTRLAGGRRPATDAGDVSLAGDDALGQQVLAHLGYTI